MGCVHAHVWVVIRVVGVVERWLLGMVLVVLVVLRGLHLLLRLFRARLAHVLLDRVADGAGGALQAQVRVCMF